MLVSELSRKIHWWLHSFSWNQYSLLGPPQFLPKGPKKRKHPGSPKWVETWGGTLELVLNRTPGMNVRKEILFLAWALLGSAWPSAPRPNQEENRSFGEEWAAPHIPAWWTSIRVVGEESFWRENRILGLGWAQRWNLSMPSLPAAV